MSWRGKFPFFIHLVKATEAITVETNLVISQTFLRFKKNKNLVRFLEFY